MSWIDAGSDRLKPSGHTWDKTLAGRLSFNFTVTTAGAYTIMVLIDTAGRDCWLWVEIDGQRRSVGPRSFGRTLHSTPGMRWSDGGGESEITLSAGSHVIDIYSLTAGATVDAFALVPSSSTAIQDGDPDSVYPTENASGDAAAINSGGFDSWLNDESRDASRVLLVELDHSDGTVRLASLPWVGDGNLFYDDWVINSPYLEIGLSDSKDVGDVEAVNPEIEEDWLDYDWRGHRCRMYFGDELWQKDEFRLVASASIEACRSIDDRTYRFDLISDAQKYRRTFHTGDAYQKTDSVENIVKWAISQHESGGSFQYINITPAELDVMVSFEVTESLQIEKILNTVAASIKAETRISQSGHLEIIRPDTDNPPSIEMTADNVVGNLRMVDVIPPVKRVTVNYGTDQSETADTGAFTGILDEEVIIDTYLTTQAEAEALAFEHARDYANTRQIWEAESFRVSNLVRPGDVVTIAHPEVTGTGVCNQVRMEPLTNIGRVEVTI